MSLSSDTTLHIDRSALGEELPKTWLRTICIIWAGQAFSILTSYGAGFAATWYVAVETASPFMLGLMSIAAMLPAGLLSPLGGVVADRFSRKHVIIAADMFVGVVSLLLALLIVLDFFSIWLIVALTVVRSCGQAFHSPAMMAAMPQLVPERHLLRVNSLDQLLIGIAGIISPAIGIALLTVFGLQAVFLIDFVGALVASLALVFVSIPQVKSSDEEHPGVVAQLAHGFQALKVHRGLFLLVILSICSWLFFSPMGALYPLITLEVFNGTGFHASVIEATFAGGMLVGSLCVMSWGNRGHLTRIVALATLCFGLLAGICGILSAEYFVLFAILCALMGIAVSALNSPVITLIQLNTDSASHGRILGFINAAICLASPLGIALGTTLAQSITIPVFFVVDGIICAALSIPMFLFPAIKALDQAPQKRDRIQKEVTQDSESTV